MELRELTRILASLTEDEYRQVVTEARGADTLDVKTLIYRELARQANEQPAALNDDQALTRNVLGDN